MCQNETTFFVQYSIEFFPSVGFASVSFSKCQSFCKQIYQKYSEENFFKNEGIDCSHITRCTNGEKIGLTFTEIRSETESSITMYRNEAADLKLDVADIDEEYIKKAIDNFKFSEKIINLINYFTISKNNCCYIVY